MLQVLGKCQIAEQTLKQEFFFPPTASLNKGKLDLTCNFLLYIWEKKNPQIQPMILKMEFPSMFCYSTFTLRLPLFAKCAHYFFQ